MLFCAVNFRKVKDEYSMMSNYQGNGTLEYNGGQGAIVHGHMDMEM